MKCARRNEENVVGANHAVTRIHRGPFHDRQNVALHAFAGYVWPVATFSSGDLVDLIQKDDAALLHTLYGYARDLVHIYEPLLFFLDQILERLRDFHLALLSALAKQVREHVLKVDIHLLDALIGDDLKVRHAALAYFEFHVAVIQLALA